MTKEELATMICGREYRQELFPEEGEAARAAGLVVVFGASDDLMEFRGAIHDEVGAIDGGTAWIVNGNLWIEPESECDHGEHGCKYAQAADKAAKASGHKIEAIWCQEGSPYAWQITSDVPHAVFEIVEDGDPFCRGIVFDLKDCATAQ